MSFLGGRARFALGVVCQLSLVALAAYGIFGCTIAAPTDPEVPSCSDVPVTLSPGGCTNIEVELSQACPTVAWSYAHARFLFLTNDAFRGEYFVEGGAPFGSPVVETSLCAGEGLLSPFRIVSAEVWYLPPDFSPHDDYSITPVNLHVTLDPTRACARDLCVDASIDQSGPVPNQAQLSIVVDATEPYEVVWTADRVPSGITPGDETLEILDVTLSGETTYTATVTLTNLTPAGAVVSVSDSVTALFAGGNAPPIAVDDAYGVDEGGSLFVPVPGVLANDSDPESDALTVGVSVLPTNGTLTLNGDGSFVYTPTPGFNGEDSFSYIANDGTSDSNEATVTITVNPTGNQAPVGVPDAYAVGEDDTLVIDASMGVLANDTDGNGDPLTAALVDDVTNGALVLNPDGSFGYAPEPDWNGEDSFTYTASDGIATSAPVSVTLTVTSVNDPPVANAGSDVAVRVGAIAQIDGSGSSDPDGGPAPLSHAWTFILPLPAGSALTDADIAGANSAAASFTPDVVGRFTLNLWISDGADSANDQVDVLAGNAAPNAGPDEYALDEDGTLGVVAPGVLGNDSDAEGDPLTAVLVTGPSNGTLDLRADGSFDYAPAPDYNGDDSFTYRANDGDLDSADTTVTITVNPINDAPIAAADAYVTDEDVALDVPAVVGVLANDGDADSDVLSVALVDDVANGTLTLNPDGSFRYVPDANANGADGFTYTASDGVETTPPVAVEITVTPVPDPPLANAGPDVSVRVSRLASVDGSASSDPDTGAPLASFLWNFVPPLPAGSALTNADIAGATTALASFTPDVAGSFTLNLEVSNGVETASDQVNVLAGNSAPVANPDAYAVDEDSPLAIAAPGTLANDTDPEGDPLTAILSTGASNGALALDPNGSFLYTPAANSNGTDSFTYVANDGDLSGAPALVTITVRPVNDAPTSSADAYSVDEDTTLTVVPAQGVLSNDADIDADVLSATLVAGVANGSLALAANGSFVYTPDENFNGTDSFTYTTSDGTVSTAATTVTITIDAVNDAPVADAGPDLDGVVGTSIPLDATGSSDIDGDTLTYLWSFTQVPTGSAAAIVDPTSASASFVPDASGQFTVQLVVNDGTVDSAADTAIFLVTFCTDLTVNWVPNASGNWSNGANWSTGSVPGPGDNACVDVPADITVTHDSGDDSVATLVSAENLVLSGGSLSLAGPSFVYRSFTHGFGTLAGAGSLTVRGLFTWSGGTQEGPGQTLGAGGILLDGSTTTMTMTGRTIVNAAGRLALWTNGVLVFSEGGGFVNQGTFRTDFDGDSFYTFNGARSVFANTGAIEKTGGLGTSSLAFALSGGGTATSSSGTLAFTGGGTSSTAFTGPATIGFAGAFGSPHVLSGSISVANTVFSVGESEIDGAYNVSASTTLRGVGIANFNAAATVGSIGALTIEESSAANFSSGEVPVASSFTQTSGVLTGTDTITVTGSMSWDGGEQRGPGTTDVRNGMTLAGTTKQLLGRTIVNAPGRLATWTEGTILLGEGGGFVNQGTFRTDFDGDSFYTFNGARSVFANTGAIEKTGGLGTSSLAFALSGGGTATSSSGTLAFTGGGTSSTAFTGPATIGFAGAFGSPHVLSGSISVANMVFSVGESEIDGAYNVSASTTLRGVGIANFNAAATVGSLGALTIEESSAANFSSGEVPVASSLTQTSGVLTGTDTITVTGSMSWDGGEQRGPGTTDVRNGMTLAGTTKQLLGRTIVNAPGRLATWTEGTILLGEGGGFVNQGTFRTDFDGDSYYTFNGARSVFANTGVIEKTGGLGTSSLAFALSGGGTATSSSGTLAFTGGGTNSTAFMGPATIGFAGAFGSPHVLSGSISVANVVFSVGESEIDGAYNVSASTTLRGVGIANFNAAATVGSIGALTIEESSAANFSSGEVPVASSLTQTSGVLTGTDTITVTGSMSWDGGEQRGPGTTDVRNGMTLAGTTKQLLGRTIVNAPGRLATWTEGTILLGEGGGFVNQGTFRTDFDGDSYYTFNGARSVFANSGIFEKTGGGGATLFAFAFDNVGVLRPVTGTLDVAGDFVQSGAGALDIVLSGAGAPGTDYDQVNVAGASTLGGALNVSLSGGFVPASGDAFEIMTYGSATGGFTSQSLPPLGGGLSWNVSVGPAAVTLSVVP